jgi:hypothetical protein
VKLSVEIFGLAGENTAARRDRVYPNVFVRPVRCEKTCQTDDASFDDRVRYGVPHFDSG